MQLRNNGRWNRSCLGIGLFMGIFLVVGVGISIWGVSIVRNGAASENWPSTAGEIVEAYVRDSTDEDGTTYHAEVTFRYTVNDQWYAGDTVNFGEYGSSDYSHAQEIVDRYSSGQRVTVYYKPDSPGTAVLEPGLTWSSYLVLGIGLCFAGVPMLILFFGSIGRWRR
jgi:hypothetical protein